MRILAADDEQPALDALNEAITRAAPGANVLAFKKPSELLQYAGENECDAAFIDIKMRGMTGIEIAKRLKELQPKIEIVFVTGYSEYALEAFGLHARGYVIKPVTQERVREELACLDISAPRPASRVYAQTFGSFELFIDGQPLKFRRGRAKEILAFLIDRRGAAQTIAQIAAAIFEDKPYDRSMQKQMQVYISDLRMALREHDAQALLIRSRNSLAIDTTALSCDYYDFINMEPYAVRAYNGEYMTNYSWAEFTVAQIDQAER